MLSVELRVNGSLIGMMSIVNKSATTAVPINEVTGKSTYEYEYYEFTDGNRRIIESGGVHHSRREGAAKLVALAFTNMLEDRGVTGLHD